MKVILLSNVPALGKKFDIVNVKDGHALNYLIPNKLAQVATPDAEKAIAKRKEKEVIHMEEIRAREKEIAQKLKDAGRLTMKRKTSSKEHLFAAVTEKDIAHELQSLVNIQFDPHHIHVKNHIKSLGVHPIYIKLGETSVAFDVHVEKAE